jgi:hypothetical protein
MLATSIATLIYKPTDQIELKVKGDAAALGWMYGLMEAAADDYEYFYVTYRKKILYEYRDGVSIK